MYFQEVQDKNALFECQSTAGGGKGQIPGH